MLKNRSMIKTSGKINPKKNIKKKLKLNKSFEKKTEEEKIIQLETPSGAQNNDLENEESGQIENIEKKLEEGEQEEKENNSENENIAEEFEKEEKLRNVNIKLNSFEEKQIKALIRYYFFNKDLRENINKSNSNNKQFNAYDCYLINHIWMQNFKIFYLYDELVEIIEQILDEKNNQNNDEQIKMVFEKLPNEYILKINGKEKEYEQNIFELLEKTHFTFLKSKKNSSYPGDFEIINPEIYNLIQKRQKINLDLMKKSFIINSNKIIIKYVSDSLLELLIGNIDFSNNKFLLEKMLEYKEKKYINIHFSYLKQNNLGEFISDKIFQNLIIEKTEFVGKIFLFDQPQEKEETSENKEKNTDKKKVKQNNFMKEYKNKLDSNQNNIIIKLLFNLHFFCNILKLEISNNNNDQNICLNKCYLIKKELIDIYSKFYAFDIIINKYQKEILDNAFQGEKQLKDFYNSLILEYQAKYYNKDTSDINYKLGLKKKLFEVSPIKYNDEIFLYFKNYLISNEPFEQCQGDYEFYYLIIQNKIILIFNNNINIGILEEKSNIFLPETIIKFDKIDTLNSMLVIMSKYGIQAFESNFHEIFKNTNNFIKIICDKKEKSNKDIKRNNFIDIDSSQQSQNYTDFNFNTSDIKKKIKKKQEEEKEKKEKKKLQSLKNILSVMVDSQLVKKKMSKSLKQSQKENYYLLNYKWFIKYIQSNNMKELFDYIISNNIVESYLNKENENNELNNNINFIEIIEKIDNNLLKNITISDNHIYELSKNNLYKVDHSYMLKTNNNYFIYYKDFILLSPESKHLFSKEISQFNIESFPVFFGDNKIFLIIQTTSKNIIEIGYLNNENIFEPTMFFEHGHSHELMQNIELLISTGFLDYQKYYLLFNEDFISPIFDQNNNRIGQAFRYEANVDDYSKFIFNEEYLKSLMGLYFSNYKLKAKFNNNEIKEELFYIINENYLKEIESFTLVENELKKFDLRNEINEAINYGNGKNDFDKLLQGKKISIILKKILAQKDNIFNKNYNQAFLPNLSPFSCDGFDFFYFDQFKLLDQSINQNLEENKIQLFQNKNNNIVSVYIIGTFILIDISNYNKNDLYGYITQVCEINNDNIISPIYILAYDNKKYFARHLNYIFQTLQWSFNNFFGTLDFSKGNGISLQLDDGKDIGILFKLSGVFPPRPPPPEYDTIEQEFKNPPLVGLKNVGATCYMNATLQCFCNLKKFVNYFKYKIKKELIKKFESSRKLNLTISFKYLIENIWQTYGNKYIMRKNNNKNSNNNYFIPKKFKETISEMNPLFAGVHANDAKDLVNFLIMTLHEELNRAPKKKDLNDSNLNNDQSNKELVLSVFAKSFMNENVSLISDLFYAMNDSVTECLNCHKRKYNFQIYFFLIFPLEEVRKYKIQNLYNSTNQNMMFFNPMNQMAFQQNFIFQNNNQNIINSVNLDDCFRYNQKIEHFTGENAMYCNTCRGQYPAYNQTVLSTGPEILIIILNRGKGIEFKVKCEFALQINLYEYIEMKNTGYMYDLVGVVTHLGESDSSGHFIAYCKSPIDKNWYQYNDDLVFPVNNFVNDVINYAMPYILFYQKQQYN